MSKYKFNFKAQDRKLSEQNIIEIKSWLEDNGWSFKYENDEEQIRAQKVMTRDSDGWLHYEELIINIIGRKEIAKLDEGRRGNYQKTFGVASFTNEELKFFDSMNYQIMAYHAKKVNQSITDWFGKV